MLGEMKLVHDFSHSLELASREQITAKLDDLYRKVFSAVTIQRITGRGPLEGELQRKGIDVVVTTQAGQRYHLDEKIRDTEYDDLLLEEYSDYELAKPGWLEAETELTDFVVYVKPSGVVHILPYILLRNAYLRYKEEWLRKFGRRFAANIGFRTSNIPVPWEELKRALCEEMTKHLQEGDALLRGGDCELKGGK